MTNLFESIKKRNEFRKNTKKALDSVLSFSIGKGKENKFSTEFNIKDSTATLLTEGSVLYSDGTMRCYLAKGTLEKFINGKNEYLDNLDNEYLGTVNIGHSDYVSSPHRIVGTWEKKNLHLVDLEDGRKAMEIDKMTIDYQHPLIQILKNSKAPIGLSAEFYYHIDEEASENATQVLRQAGIEDYVTVIDEICISDYAIVGECGDVNASNLFLEIGDDKVEDIKEPVVDKAEETETEKTTKTDETVETTETEKTVETDETVEQTEDEENSMEEVLSIIKEIQEEIAKLRTESKEVAKENDTLKEQLKAKETETKKMFNAIKLAGEEQEVDETEETEDGYVFDPIGHL